MKEIEIESRYERQNSSYLDPYFEKIKKLFYEGNSIKYIFHYLNNTGAQCKYGNLRNYIHKNFKKNVTNYEHVQRSEVIILITSLLFNTIT